MLNPTQFKITPIIILGLCAAVTLSGCSISDSAGSIADSSGAIAQSSESISESSTDDKAASKSLASRTINNYENEAADFTITYLRANQGRVNPTAFMKSLSDIASENGIVDWEANPKTYRAIGKALKKNPASDDSYDLSRYKATFGENDPAKMHSIQAGYDGAQ